MYYHIYSYVSEDQAQQLYWGSEVLACTYMQAEYNKQQGIYNV